MRPLTKFRYGSFHNFLMEEQKDTGYDGPLVVGVKEPRSSSSDGFEISMTGLCCPDVLSTLLAMPLWLLCLCCNCNTVQEREEAVVLVWGRYVGTIKQPGLYCINPCGVSLTKVSTKKSTVDLPTSKILDLNGNPVMVSAIITYNVTDSKKAALDVTGAEQYVKTQGLAVMKNIVSSFPYESHDGGSSLRADAAAVSAKMTRALQEVSDVAGVKIISFELTDLSYAPEIAASMLMRQQAQAVVAARTTIVQGAVGITESAISNLEAKGFKFTQEEKNKLVSNLLVTLCAEQKAQPVISLDS